MKINVETGTGRVSRKFVPLISCTIMTFDQNFIFTWNFYKIFISGMPFLFACLFVCLFFYHSVALAAWSGIQRVDQQMIASILSFFITWCAGASSIPKQYLFSLDSWKKTYFGHSSKKDNHPRPLPQQGFCTSLQIWDELDVTWQTIKQRVVLVVVVVVFFAISGAIKFTHFKHLFMTLCKIFS